LVLFSIVLVASGAGKQSRRFSVESAPGDPRNPVVLKDLATGSLASIAVSTGANCTTLQLAPNQGSPYQLIGSGGNGPGPRGDGGMPVLFPWCGAISGAAYEFEGKTRQVPPEVSRGALHGFVARRPWRISRTDADSTSASLECIISHVDCPEARDAYPFKFELSLLFALENAAFVTRAVVRNTGDSPMPFGLGLHPYFRVPLEAGTTATACSVQIPAKARWDLQECLAVRPGFQPGQGRQLPHPLPLGDAGDIVKGRPLVQGAETLILRLADSRTRHGAECLISNPASDSQIVLRMSPEFSNVVLFTPPGKPIVALEPWTSLPNGFNLASAGMKDAGIVILPAGASWEAQIQISIHAPALR
jgi:aldose 1-epimerase